MMRQKAEHYVTRQLIVKWLPHAYKPQRIKTYQKNGDRLIRTNIKLGYDLILTKDHVKKAMRRYQNHTNIQYVEPNYHRKSCFTPNDPYFNLQYGLKKIQMPAAWNTTKGKKNTIIAIIDTGIEPNHPDLHAKLLPGYNFITNNRNTNDDFGHGTHVAGIAAAITNNQVGVAGSAPMCKILPIKAGNAQGMFPIDSIVRGIMFAADHGAKVINMSFGGPSYSKLEEEACKYASKKAVLLVAAAGNENSDQPHYPGYFPTVIAVAATDSNDNKTVFSNYGKWVNLAAPGLDIISTYINRSYIYASGTSMSAPFVSGLAALLISQGRSNQETRRILEASADRIPGTGKYWTSGRINAKKAVRAESLR